MTAPTPAIAAAAAAAAGAGERSVLDQLGVQKTARGHRFTLFAPHAKRVELAVNVGRPHTPFTELFALEPCGGGGPTKGCWQRDVQGLPDAFEYVYRLDGGPDLLDPYARGLTGGEVWGDRSWEASGRGFRPYRGLFAARTAAAPGEGRPPRPRVADSERVIYELHLRGFTRHPSSGVAHPGTYLGLIEKIPYLQSLGITTVELLPLLEFDETENFRRNPVTGERLLNFWGYSPVSFFAPKAGYAADPSPGAAQTELMRMIDALHAAGIEVVVDVVYNHTAEGGGGASDPLHAFRGLAEEVYYLRDPATGRPFDVTGCGNTVNANHPIVRRLILDSLRFWAEEIGVDGFRFDLAAAFYRGLAGEKLMVSPLVTEIAADPRLAGRLLVAEPWDVTGFTPAGGFPAPWREWNGAFRDDVRRFVRGDAVPAPTLELRLAGSPDLFPPPHLPHASNAAIDFVTCHDGFPLADLVAYERKRNVENGEGDRDGTAANLSANNGAEGATDDPEIAARRARQAANFLALLFLSRGTPMLLAGDERGRTQRGNNNAWCQDNEVSWLDWSRDDAGRERLVRRLIELRRELATLTFGEWAESTAFRRPGAGRGNPSAGAILLLTRDEAGARTLALALNPGATAARLPLPRAPRGAAWRLVFDSATAADGTAPELAESPRFAAEASEIELPPRAIRLLLA